MKLHLPGYKTRDMDSIGARDATAQRCVTGVRGGAASNDL